MKPFVIDFANSREVLLLTPTERAVNLLAILERLDPQIADNARLIGVANNDEAKAAYEQGLRAYNKKREAGAYPPPKAPDPVELLALGVPRGLLNL